MLAMWRLASILHCNRLRAFYSPTLQQNQHGQLANGLWWKTVLLLILVSLKKTLMPAFNDTFKHTLKNTLMPALKWTFSGSVQCQYGSEDWLHWCLVSVHPQPPAVYSSMGLHAQLYELTSHNNRPHIVQWSMCTIKGAVCVHMCMLHCL
jgi:hypothetical protein